MDIVPTSLDGEGESSKVHEIIAGGLMKDDNVGDFPLTDTQYQNMKVVQPGVKSIDFVHVEGGKINLKMSSSVKEVVASIFEFLGQIRPHVEPTAVVVEEEPAAASPFKEGEVVIQTEFICLDSDDDIPKR